MDNHATRDVGSLEGILGCRADTAERVKQTSSGLDELSCEVLLRFHQ